MKTRSSRYAEELAEEVVGLHADVRAVEAALDEAPEVLDAVRVDAAVNVALGVVDGAWSYATSSPA